MNTALMELASGYPIDLVRLLETRLLVQANSGGGKSRTLRRVLEQTAGDVQQLVIDPEGEFATLRERFDYVIAAPRDADAVASPQTAALLARRLLESGVSAILDIYDLKAHDRQLFVKRFLESLVSAPRALWHPVLLVIDEAHIFCPQNGSAEAGQAVIDVCTRGRKRGLCPVLATQRLSKLHKDAAAEMLNKLIGRTGLDVDVKRAADELGMTPRDAMQQLRGLDPGTFFAFGPAISPSEVTRVTVGDVLTTHPQAGQRFMRAPPAASKRVLESLAKLAGLQQAADDETNAMDRLRAENARLKREAAAAARGSAQPGFSEADVQARIRAALDAQAKAAGSTTQHLDRKAWERVQEIASNALAVPNVSAADKPAPSSVTVFRSAGPILKKEPVSTAAGVSGPEQRILDALAWMASIGVDEPDLSPVAFLANYTAGAGAFNNVRARLKAQAWVEYLPGGRIRLTDAGRNLANFPAATATTTELHDRVLAKLPGPAQRVLRPLLSAYPKPLSNHDLAEQSGYTAGAGAFNNTRGKLRSLMLIDYPSPGTCRASAFLFPDATRAA